MRETATTRARREAASASIRARKERERLILSPAAPSAAAHVRRAARASATVGKRAAHVRRSRSVEGRRRGDNGKAGARSRSVEGRREARQLESGAKRGSGGDVGRGGVTAALPLSVRRKKGKRLLGASSPLHATPKASHSPPQGRARPPPVRALEDELLGAEKELASTKRRLRDALRDLRGARESAVHRAERLRVIGRRLRGLVGLVGQLVTLATSPDASSQALELGTQLSSPHTSPAARVLAGAAASAAQGAQAERARRAAAISKLVSSLLTQAIAHADETAPAPHPNAPPSPPLSLSGFEHELQTTHRGAAKSDPTNPAFQASPQPPSPMEALAAASAALAAAAVHEREWERSHGEAESGAEGVSKGFGRLEEVVGVVDGGGLRTPPGEREEVGEGEGGERVVEQKVLRGKDLAAAVASALRDSNGSVDIGVERYTRHTSPPHPPHPPQPPSSSPSSPDALSRRLEQLHHQLAAPSHPHPHPTTASHPTTTPSSLSPAEQRQRLRHTWYDREEKGKRGVEEDVEGRGLGGDGDEVLGAFAPSSTAHTPPSPPASSSSSSRFLISASDSSLHPLPRPPPPSSPPPTSAHRVSKVGLEEAKERASKSYESLSAISRKPPAPPAPRQEPKRTTKAFGMGDYDVSAAAGDMIF